MTDASPAANPSHVPAAGDTVMLAPAVALQLARVAYKARDWPKAETLCRLLLARLEHGDALNLLGMIAAQSGRSQEAGALFRRAVAARPDDALAHNNLGNILREHRQPREALASYDRALAIRPDFTEACTNRGNALKDLGYMEEALASYERALAIKPGNAEARGNLGVTLQDLGRFEDALAAFDRALAINLGNADAWVNRGIALQDLLRLDEAQASYQRALALNPQHAVAHWNLARCRLLAGDFAAGWAGFEWRWKVGQAAAIPPRFTAPPWLGEESLAGKTILLHAEQGLGDTLQFCRYVRLVADRGAYVILEAPPTLFSLLGSLEGVARLVMAGEALPAFDRHCPLMSLPLATGPAAIPVSGAYLHAAPAKRLYWQRKLGEKTGLRVGLVWNGGLRADQPELRGVNQRRNIDLLKLAPLKQDGVVFYSLQKGDPAQSDPARLRAAGWAGPEIIDHSAELDDFSDTAALIDNLDLVIAVDTSTAHLAGALGKPVWILNRYDSCWRWLTGRDDSPWYPDARLYRQSLPGDWDGVVARVRADLARLAGSARAGA